MKRIAFLCPYFGKLPKHTQLWLKSISFNKNCTWFLITDDKTPYNYPENVKVIYTTLSDTKLDYEKKLGFPISLEGTYKLGEYKPLFGFLYSELISGYDAWGHIDVADEIYGDIQRFVTDEMLERYDKLMLWGHMSIYKNSDEVNDRFKTLSDSEIDYKQIFSSPDFYNFEEIADKSITTLYRKNNIPIGRLDEHVADIVGLSYAFKLSNWDTNLVNHKTKRYPLIFAWDKGHVYGYSLINKKIEIKEYIYVHFKRRKMEMRLNRNDAFYILPDGFVDKNDDIPSVDFIKENSKQKLFYDVWFKEKKKGLVRRLNKLFKKKK